MLSPSLPPIDIHNSRHNLGIWHETCHAYRPKLHLTSFHKRTNRHSFCERFMSNTELQVVGRTSRHINLNVKGSKSVSNWLASETNKEDILTAENCLRSCQEIGEARS